MQLDTLPLTTVPLVCLFNGQKANQSSLRTKESSERNSGRSKKLSDKILSPDLHQRYAAAAYKILGFWRETHNSPVAWEDFDVAASQYLEYLFSEGFPKGYMDQTVWPHYSTLFQKLLGNFDIAGSSSSHGRKWCWPSVGHVHV